MKEYLQSIADEVKDIFDHDIETPKTYNVPGRDDVGLTFGRNQVKKGKLIETCILFVDIRKSTLMSRGLKNDKARLGKIYSAFIKAMVSIADKYGYVRNIIGDRVMVVFEPGNCFIDAVNCAVMMHTVATRILKKHTGYETFKCGIGIEFGEMLVLKTGIPKKHEEQSEYKNLVWVGDAANTASKLTDFSNKEYNSPLYNLSYDYVQQERYFKGYKSSTNTTLHDRLRGVTSKLEPEYDLKFVKRTATISISAEDFHKKVKTHPVWKYEDKILTGIVKVEQNGTTAPILMSGKIYEEYKKAEPNSLLLKNFIKRQYPNQPHTGTGIYGGSAVFTDIAHVKI